MSLKILYLYYGGKVWVQCLGFYLLIPCVFMCLKPNMLLQQCHSWILNRPLMVEPQSTKPSIKLVVIVNARNQRLDLNLMGKKNQNLNVESELDFFSSIFLFNYAIAKFDSLDVVSLNESRISCSIEGVWHYLLHPRRR